MGFEDQIVPPADPVCRKEGKLIYPQEQTAQILRKPARHCNITLKRLLLDAYQFLRAQSFIADRFGRQYRPSNKYAEVDITYKCNLKCINCNRSCSQAPSNIEMPVAQIMAFIQQSIEKNIAWERIRILGGEPTLHSRFLDIIDLLIDYRRRHNPAVRLVLSTNFFGDRVRQVLAKLPKTITIKSTLKSSRVNLFKPFNLAPVDTKMNRYSDYSCGCRIIEDCGLGVTPSGYYVCAVAGGIDRIFGFDLGRKQIPDAFDTLTDQMSAFCRYCGHFGFQWPTRRTRISTSWQSAYRQLNTKE